MVAQLDTQILRARPRKFLGRLAAWALIEGRQVTTKGQWINPLVFRLYDAARAFPLRKGSDRPIFIVGTGRSGTTVLGKIFGLHRDCAFLNEPKAAWHHVFREEDMIGSYSTGPARVFLGEDDADPRLARRLAHVYSVAMAFAGAERPVDKYPELLFRVPFAARLFPKARFIVIVRDGADTCASVTAWSGRNAEMRLGEMHDWWGRAGRKWRLIVEQVVPRHADLAPLGQWLLQVEDHRDRAAVEWIVSMRAAIEAAQGTYAPHVLIVKYEDLCAAPDALLGEMFAHCGLPPDGAVNAYAKSILETAPAYSKLEIAEPLVAPFIQTLADMGYGDSAGRIVARD